MTHRFRAAALAAAFALSAFPAGAQYLNPSTPIVNGAPVSTANPMPVTGGGGGGGGAITAPLGPSTTAANSVAFTFGSGSTLPAFATTPSFNLTSPLPAGTNAIGSVTVSNFPATQPISGSVTVSTGTVTANQGTAHAAGSAGWIFAANLVFNETTTNLAANAVFTGTSQTTAVADGTASPWTTFNVMVVTNQIGSITIQGSTDGVTWVPQVTEATISVPTAQLLSTPVFFEFQRVVYTNGATATTSLVIKTSYSFE